MKNITLLVLSHFIGNSILAQIGLLDPSFGTNGFTFTTYPDSTATIRGIAIGNEHEIYILGSLGRLNFTDYGLFVSRYSPNGALDTDYGTGGKVLINMSPNPEEFCCSAVQPDGKLVVGGRTFSGDNSILVVFRLMPDGSLDNSFGDNGSYKYGENGDLFSLIDLTIQPDGKIVLCGLNYTSGLLMRLNQDGSIDQGFNGGQVLESDMIGEENFEAVAIDPGNNSIFVAGRTFLGSENDMVIAKYNADGSTDTNFNGTGYRVIGLTNGDGSGRQDFTSDIVSNPDGTILVSGHTNSVGVLLKLDSNTGIFDSAFGNNGIGIYELPDGVPNPFMEMHIQADNKIVTCGHYFTTGEVNRMIFQRFLPSGTLDIDFGEDGSIILNKSNDIPNLVGSEQQFGGAAFASDGGLVVGAFYDDAGFTQSYQPMLLKFAPETFTIALEHLDVVGLNIYPNPINNGWQTVHSASPEFTDLLFSLYNSQGCLVKDFGKRTLWQAETTQLDYTNLSSGFYLLKIQNGNQAAFTMKVVINQN